MMATDNEDICLEWSQPEELRDPAESQMEGPRGNLQRESSISFGRFESDSLSWEKWSSFSQNRYLEEVERFSTPGSVIQKKAYFEAHFKKIAAQKALEQQAQLESQLGIGSNYYDEEHHLGETTESPDQNGEGNDEDYTFSHSIVFDNSPHKTDTEEGNLTIRDPKNRLCVGQAEDPIQHVSLSDE
ncbi:hypothetical protein KI387_010851 [Taxus chinensis]|uniref:Protein WVD2-like 7 n=1 Tax=Taxus chinensis TaxID=29808 RepID=A0AA38FLP1_TAXCH|nr:hypothetical protein KI387_010851 [Taxus chinensis]